MTRLEDWLTACVDEDERDASEIEDDVALIYTGDPSSPEILTCDATRRRALAEVAFKRAILALHRPSPGLRHPISDNHVDICDACEVPELLQSEWERVDPYDGSLYPCQTVRLLAAVYCDRTGYQEAISGIG